MKKLSFLLFTLAAINYAVAQVCLPEGITFTTQEQIDNFQVNYPGCTAIEGSVSVIDNNYWSGLDITNLDGLNMVTSIGGNLTIQCYILPSLAGLSELDSIGGDFSLGGYNMNGGISGNSMLTSLAGLESLTFIGGNLNILGNGSLVSLTGIENVTASSIGNINIHDNVALASCNIQSICEYLAAPNGSVDIYHNAAGCDSPVDIANACSITLPCLPYGNYYFFSQNDIDNFPANYPGCSDLQGTISITGDDIVNLTGLSQVNSIGQDLNIGRYYGQQSYGNPLLTSLSGLENLSSIGGTLMIIKNDTLSTLTGLENLTTIAQDLLIGISYVFPADNMGALTSISALGNLTSVGGQLYISSTSLANLVGLENLAHAGSITIYSNALLADISSLSDLTYIPGSLDIYHTAVSSLAGLDNVDTIGGRVIIAYNNIENFTGMNALKYIGGGAWIFKNGSLSSMEGLDNLEYIDGYLDLWNNPLLVSLEGLENLDSLGSYLSISANGVKSLSALSGLQSVNGSLRIIYNDSLTSLSGIDNLITDSINELKIFYNSQLQTCEVQSICNYLAGPHGVVEIYSNAPGCNSQAEVEEGCGIIGIEELSHTNGFSIYPNPSKSQITIETSTIPGLISILDLSGRLILNRQVTEPETVIDVSTLPRGVYFIGFQNEKTVKTGKIIKN